jgi:polyphosphate kinase
VSFDYLLVSPQNSRRLLYEMIDREIANAQNGQPSGITLKLNNLVDKGLVDDCMPRPAPACRLTC